MRAPSSAAKVAEIPPAMSNGCPQAEADLALAAAGKEIAAAIQSAVERFGPAADTIAGCGERLDSLCAWLKGKWPWIGALGLMLASRTVNMAPDDVPKLIKAVASVLQAFQGG